MPKADEKRFFATAPEAHRRLLSAFTQAASEGDIDSLVSLLAEDAVLVTDGGPEGRRTGGIRNLRAPLYGARRIASFVSATARSADLAAEIHELNGQPALVFYDDDQPFALSCSLSRRIAFIASSSMRTLTGCAAWALERVSRCLRGQALDRRLPDSSWITRNLDRIPFSASCPVGRQSTLDRQS